MLAAPLLSYGLSASLVLFGCRRFSRDGLAGDGGAGAGAEPAGEEEEALQFGLVFMESALAPGVSGPAWLRLWRWVVPEDPSGGGQVGTWQQAQAQAGLGAPRGLRTRLGHQDGLLPHFQDVC